MHTTSRVRRWTIATYIVATIIAAAHANATMVSHGAYALYQRTDMLWYTDLSRITATTMATDDSAVWYSEIDPDSLLIDVNSDGIPDSAEWRWASFIDLFTLSLTDIANGIFSEPMSFSYTIAGTTNNSTDHWTTVEDWYDGRPLSGQTMLELSGGYDTNDIYQFNRDNIPMETIVPILVAEYTLGEKPSNAPEPSPVILLGFGLICITGVMRSRTV